MSIIKEKPIVISESKSVLPDGFYTGIVSGYVCRITSQDFYNKEFRTKYGIKGTVAVIVVVKESIAYLFDSIMY